MRTKKALVAAVIALFLFIGMSVLLNLYVDGISVGFTCIIFLLCSVVCVALAFVLLGHRFLLRKRTGNSENCVYFVDRNRKRLRFMLFLGIIAVLVMLLLSLCCGAAGILSPNKIILALLSAIKKCGQDLTYDEMLVCGSRLPRTLAALAVGIGLSIAGLIYQAIIRNPLVDPYIMGVSSGAGTAAVAVIAFEFTFFGLFSSHSSYLIAIASIVSGLAAFACTMMLAEKAGGLSVNYVLSGVIVGMAFSAIQTLMMVMAGHKIANVLTWLYGSFASISWIQLKFIFVPIITMSIIPLIWAREFNLILFGEDQAKQMGLDVKWFNRCMLTYASVLTSICVSFVGIIGFVGLIVPHLCRMFIGSDHRMVMPASIFVGALIMMIADLISKMMCPGMELPVGAITTMVGVPVFIWLFVKKGKMYNG
ncbi:MAG: iron ABC transporter permease [archaeon]|nr:iron ABC transporter permease [archaeon]